jgi:hypothetical protein
MKPVDTFRARYNTVHAGEYSRLQRYLATRAIAGNGSAALILAAVRASESAANKREPVQVTAADGRPVSVHVRDWPRSGAYNPRAEDSDKVRGYRYVRTHARWIEDTARAGLRLVGNAADIVRDLPTGWYCDNFQSETFAAVVYRLPARNGQPVFVYGYADPWNTGAAFLCFDNDAETDRDAARFADSFTERRAEESREFYAKEQAATDIEEAREAIREARDEHSELCAEIRAERAERARLKLPERAKLRREVSRQRDIIKARAENHWTSCPDYC